MPARSSVPKAMRMRRGYGSRGRTVPAMAAPLPLTADFASSRTELLERAAAAGASATAHPHPMAGPGGTGLAADTVWLGPEDAPSVVLVVSGTHGVEGYAGSALQRTWLRDADPARPDGVAVCLLHALNPYGFAWVRRVNEDNVDLNRNFVDFADPPANDGYDRIAHLLVPEHWDEQTQASTTAGLLAVADEHGFAAFQEWVTGGQYRHPDGLFYGGTAPTWSHRLLDDLCRGRLAGRSASPSWTCTPASAPGAWAS